MVFVQAGKRVIGVDAAPKTVYRPAQSVRFHAGARHVFLESARKPYKEYRNFESSSPRLDIEEVKAISILT